jgi:hypothetical protein
MLMFAEDDQSIMDELRKSYGRPERVIVGLMDEIMKMNSPRDQPEHKMRDFAVKVKNFVASAKAMKMDTELDNEFALAKLAAKLHPSAYREWMKIRLRQPKANLEKFAAFLTERMLLLPPPPETRRLEHATDQRGRSNRPFARIMAHQDDEGVSQETVSCFKCQRPHETAKCYALKRATLAEREELVALHRLCKSCLNTSKHEWRNCPRKARCNTEGCSLSHHPLLHDPNAEQTHYVNSHRATGLRWREQRHVHQPVNKARSSKVLFKVVPVTLFGNHGTTVKTHALLDGGSSITLMEEKLFHELHLEGTRRSLTLQWTGEMKKTEDSYLTSIALSGDKNRKLHKLTGVNTVKNLALPTQTVIAREMQERYRHLRDIPLSDIQNAKPQLLIGIRQAKLFVSRKVRAGGDDEPVAAKTDLGWIVFGNTSPSFNFVALNLEETETQFSGQMTVPIPVKDLHQLHNEQTENDSRSDVATHPRSDLKLTKSLISKEMAISEKAANPRNGHAYENGAKGKWTMFSILIVWILQHFLILCEYLSMLPRCCKWFSDAKSIEEDDIAILIDTTKNRDAWKLGRITTVNSEPGNRNRSADILLNDETVNKKCSTGRLAILGISKSLNEGAASKDGADFK